MPPEFQKILDTILHNLQNTFAFIEDILIVTKGTKQQYTTKVEEVIKVLDEAGDLLKLEKAEYPKETRNG